MNLKDLDDEGMVSDLVRCSLTSSGIIGEDSELLSWQKEVAKSMCIREKHLFIPPMKGWIFVNVLNKRSKGLMIQVYFHSYLIYHIYQVYE